MIVTKNTAPHNIRIIKQPDPSFDFSDKDVCILITFSGDGVLRSGTYAYYQELIKNGIHVILCVIVDNLDLAKQEDRLHDATSVIYRLNGGWDFSAWADTLRHMPQLWNAKRLYFTNDSIFCLPDNFTQTIDRVRQSQSDFIALTECGQIKHHTQSFFFILQNNALSSPVIREYWSKLKAYETKGEVINAYEVTYLSMIKDAGLSYDILFSYDFLFPSTAAGDLQWLNPTYHLWETLVYKGFPFVKVSLFTRNSLKADIVHWKHLIAEYGANVKAYEQHIIETAAYKTAPEPKFKNFFKNFRKYIYQSRITNKRKRVIKIFKIPVYIRDL